MIRIDEEVRDLLSHPFGSVCDVDELISTGRKLVAVGDAVSLATLEAGHKPFVSVFDGKTLRTPLEEGDLNKLKSAFSHLEVVENPPGHFNPSLLETARRLMRTGGALYIEGEEDIAGLAFLYYATEEHVVYYGIRGLGLIMVEGEQGSKIAEYVLKKIGGIS